MNFTYENQGTNTYLVYQVAPDDVIDSMSLGMLTNNKIDGLATTLFMQVDMTKYIKYNVSAKVSVKQFFSGPVNKKRLVGVFSGIVNAMLSAEDYMIDTNTILLDMDYIFADVSTCETVLICVPVMGVNESVPDIGAFFKNIVFSTQFDQTENCDYVAKIINYLNSTPVFSLSSFSEILKDIERGGVVKQAAPQPVQPVQRPVQSVPKTTPRQVQRPVQQMQQPVQQSVPQQVQKPVQQQPQQQSGFKVPGKEVPSQPVQQSVQQAGNSEKKMSMFYLLQHYSKENAAVYKAQKEADKGVKKSADKEEKVKKSKKKGKETAPVNTSFQVPGAPIQQTNQGFAIPGQPEQTLQQSKQQVSSIQSTVQQSAQQSVQQVVPISIQQPTVSVSQGQANFGETTVLTASGIGETTVLNMTGQNTPNQPYLIRARNNEKIMLNKPVFRIGKERSYVDYFIGDNTAISRSHANIITRENAYFIIDTNSTNHTLVNGKMINSNEEVQINHGDTVQLANENFYFKLY